MNNKGIVAAIVGSRTFTDYDFLKKTLNDYRAGNDLIGGIVSGGAAGADRLAERYAGESRIPIEIIKPDWKKYGRGAGLLRNTAIIEQADVVFAFWDGKSRGTRDSIIKATNLKKEIHVIQFIPK